MAKERTGGDGPRQRKPSAPEGKAEQQRPESKDSSVVEDAGVVDSRDYLIEGVLGVSFLVMVISMTLLALSQLAPGYLPSSFLSMFSLAVDSGDSTVVTCGSAISLTHHSDQFTLHTPPFPYGSGSRQRAVTIVPSRDPARSLWVVGGGCNRGDPISQGQTITLEHADSGLVLTADSAHRSPLSGSTEASVRSVQDQYAQYIAVLRVEWAGGGVWRRGLGVRLVNEQTGLPLKADSGYQFSDPIRGHGEVAWGGLIGDPRGLWVADGGVFIAHTQN